MTKDDEKELKLWRKVGHYENDHSYYCDCRTCEYIRALSYIIEKNEIKKKSKSKKARP